MVRIISDSTGDLTKELQERFDIAILPLYIILDEKEYRDGIDITDKEIYEWSDKNKTTPKTSAVSMEDTLNLLRPIVEAGDEAVVYTISASMSTTNNVIKMAAAELNAEDKIFAVDTANLSTGVGILAIEGAKMAKAGASGAEIAARMEELKPLVRASFVVDTLTYLHRGGRCSSVAALAGSALKLHPRIVVKDGAMSADKKYRGKMDSVIMNYTKDLEADFLKAKPDFALVTHSPCDPSVVNSVIDYLKGLNHFTEIIDANAGGVICSHCGPGTLGVIFMLSEQ